MMKLWIFFNLNSFQYMNIKYLWWRLALPRSKANIAQATSNIGKPQENTKVSKSPQQPERTAVRQWIALAPYLSKVEEYWALAQAQCLRNGAPKEDCVGREILSSSNQKQLKRIPRVNASIDSAVSSLAKMVILCRRWNHRIAVHPPPTVAAVRKVTLEVKRSGSMATSGNRKARTS